MANFLFERKKESWKPCAPCRGRHPGQRGGGSFYPNSKKHCETLLPRTPGTSLRPIQRLSPRRGRVGRDGGGTPLPGGRTGYPSKTPQWGVLEIAKNCTVHPFPPRGSVTAGAPRPLQTVDQHPQAGGDGDEGKGGELLFSQILHREPKSRQQGGDKKGL